MTISRNLSILAEGVTTTGVLNISNGGTGSTTASAALTALGGYSNTNPSGYTSNVGTVTSVAGLTLGTTGSDLNSTVSSSTTTPVITLNVPTASSANRGALSPTDWIAFNAKQAALISGSNIKTVSGATILGSGDLGIIAPAYGGTGVNNGSATLNMANSVFFNGPYLQSFTATANTALTLPTSGTVISTVTNMAANPVTGSPSSSTYLRGDGTWASIGSGMVYPGAGIANSTGSAWDTSYGVTGTGSVVLSSAPTLTGAVVIGGTTDTATLTLGQSTVSQTINIGTGVTNSSSLKTINIGTNSATGSSTNIVIGPTAGSVTTTLNGSVSIPGGFSTAGFLTVSGQLNLYGSISGTQSLATNQQSALIILGGANATGGIILGRSTLSQTIDIASANTSSTSGITAVNIANAGSAVGSCAVNIATGTYGVSNILTLGNTASTININGDINAIPDNVTLGTAAGTLNLNTTGTGTNTTIGTTGDGAVFTVNHDNTNITSGTIGIGVSTSQTTLNGSTILVKPSTSGTVSIGNTTGTGTITLGNSTAGQTVNIATGIIGTGVTNNINIGNNGVGGSTTNITIGSSNGSTSVNSGLTVAGTFTANSDFQLVGSSSVNQVIGSNQLTNSITVGGPSSTGSIIIGRSTGAQSILIGNASSSAQVITIGGANVSTGTITLGRSIGAQTVNIATGVTAAAATKTVNIGTSGNATSLTNITIGSTAGASTTFFNGLNNFPTLTASQAVFTDISNNLVSVVLPTPANAPYTTLAYGAGTPTLVANNNYRISLTTSPYTLTINPPAIAPTDGTMIRLWIINPTTGGAGTAVNITLNAGIKIPTSSSTTSPISLAVGIKMVLAIQYDATSNTWQLATMINGYSGY